MWVKSCKTENSICFVADSQEHHDLTYRDTVRTKDSCTKKFCNNLAFKNSLLKPFEEFGVAGGGGAQTICFLASSYNKPFSAPNLGSVCWVSLCAGATNLHSVTL